MSVRRAAATPLLLALVAVPLAAFPASAARKQRVTGSLDGVPAATPAVVAAVDPSTLEVLAAARVEGTRRYSLPAEPRVTMLFAHVEAEPRLFAASRAFRPADRRTRVDLTLAPAAAPTGPAPPAGVTGQTAVVTVDPTMTATVAGRPRRIDHLVEEILLRAGTRRCGLRMVTGDHDRVRAVEDEVARQQAAPADPSTAITLDPRPATVRLRGGATQSGGRQVVALEAVDVATGSVIATAARSGADATRAADRAARAMARELCTLFPIAPGDPYVVVVRGTHSAQFAYRTPDVLDPMCDSRDEADGSQMLSFESEPVTASVAKVSGVLTVSIRAAPVLFTGTRTASYRFFRDGPACFPPTPVDTSGCGAPQDPLGEAELTFSRRQVRMTIRFPDFPSCPFTSLIRANSASGEAAFDLRQLDPSGPTVLSFEERQDEDEGNELEGYVNRAAALTRWTVTFTPD